MAIQILKATEMTIQSYTLAFSVAGKMLTMEKENTHHSRENCPQLNFKGKCSPWQGRYSPQQRKMPTIARKICTHHGREDGKDCNHIVAAKHPHTSTVKFSCSVVQ